MFLCIILVYYFIGGGGGGEPAQTNDAGVDQLREQVDQQKLEEGKWNL